MLNYILRFAALLSLSCLSHAFVPRNPIRTFTSGRFCIPEPKDASPTQDKPFLLENTIVKENAPSTVSIPDQFIKSDSYDQDSSAENVAANKSAEVSISPSNSAKPVPLLQYIQYLLANAKSSFPKQFSREAITKMGGYMILSYGFVSNISYITCVIISWILHGRATGLSPLAKGQWKPFLAIYAGLWAANNVLRPLRFSFSVLIAPLFENIIVFLQKRTGFKRATCVAMTVFLVNVVGTCSFLGMGLLLATAVTNVPLFPQ